MRVWCNMSNRVGPYMAMSYPDPNRFAAKNSLHSMGCGLGSNRPLQLWDGCTHTQHGWQPYCYMLCEELIEMLQYCN